MNNPCKNDAECIMDITKNIGKCTCKLGYTGEYCETKLSCPQDFYGTNCSIKCQAVDSCDIHQTCNFWGSLECKAGWGSFPACNIRLIDQSIDPDCPVVANNHKNNVTGNGYGHLACYNGGSCSQGMCCCPPSYTGHRCEVTVNSCLSKPCQNYGLCMASEEETADGFNCLCLPG